MIWALDFLLLMLYAEPGWLELIKTVGLPIGGLIIGYLLNRQKQKAEVHETASKARKTDVEAAVIAADKIVELVDRIETAQKRARETEDALAEVSRSLDRCLKVKCEKCRQLLEQPA